MSFPTRPKNALLASYHKDERLTRFAEGLITLGWRLWGSAGTVSFLAHQGITITDVASITGQGPILGHRVVTLDQRLHAGILYRDRPNDLMQIKEIEAVQFGLVFVDLYPVQQAISSGRPLDEVIDLIDIGGPTLLRGAAKAHTEGCIVVCDLDDCHHILQLLETSAMTDDLLTAYAQKVYATMSAYDGAIAQYLSRLGPVLSRYQPMLQAEQPLRYGENPHQAAWIYQVPDDNPLAWYCWEQIQGRSMSFNNWRDWLAALWTLWYCLDENLAGCVIVKHRSPIGLCVQRLGACTSRELFEQAWLGDEQACFGGIVALNRPVGMDTAEAICQRFVEVLIAPEVTEEAIGVLSRKPNLRVQINQQLALLWRKPLLHTESVDLPGGQLVQLANYYRISPANLHHVAGPEADTWQLGDLRIAWGICQAAVSNTIVIVQNGTLLGIGAGDPKRNQAAQTAVSIAQAGALKDRVVKAVAASDSFFPFPDGAETLIDAGVKVILHSGGSRNDQQVVDLCRARGVSLYYTSDNPNGSTIRAFRH